MKTAFRWRIWVLLGVLAVGTAQAGSHILVGKARPKTDPATVVVYLEPPARYEQIAIVEADSNGSFRFTAQGKVDKAIERLKKQAAKVGANAILLKATGESGAAVLMMPSGGGQYDGGAMGVVGGGLIKSVSGIAIWETKLEDQRSEAPESGHEP